MDVKLYWSSQRNSLSSAFERSEVRLGDGSSVFFSGTFQLSECLLTQGAENRLFWLKHSLSAHLTSLLLAEVGAPEKDEEKDHCLLSSFNTRQERRTHMSRSQISYMSLLSPAVMLDQMKRTISKFYAFVKFRFWFRFQLLCQHERFIASCDWEMLNVLCKNGPDVNKGHINAHYSHRYMAIPVEFTLKMVKLRCNNGPFIPPTHRADMPLLCFFK